MDEYVSEKEQIEQIRSFLRDNRWYILGGIVLGVALLLGWNRYNAYKEQQAQAAGALYESMRQAAARDGGDTDVERLFKQLQAQYPSSPYTDQAALLVARTDLVSDPEQAMAQLRHVMETSKDPELALVARLRLSRMLAYREQYSQALDLLSVEKPDSFAARFNEVEGDIYTAMKNYTAARAAYQRALAAPLGQFLLDRNYVQMKLDDLPPVEIPAEPQSEGGS